MAKVVHNMHIHMYTLVAAGPQHPERCEDALAAAIAALEAEASAAAGLLQQLGRTPEL